ncbi:hypothetical protein PRZ48_011488 [Zasmidium cellare]|uniref:Uncharacterized protein n=1 Tax=Zasmidium cellare TaxID=395010 RepID=A0ABR0E6U1_ZASCE|nr:hypothetical protein PRZ48_011488 [Zasmidium cellare]
MLANQAATMSEGIVSRDSDTLGDGNRPSQSPRPLEMAQYPSENSTHGPHHILSAQQNLLAGTAANATHSTSNQSGVAEHSHSSSGNQASHLGGVAAHHTQTSSTVRPPYDVLYSIEDMIKETLGNSLSGRAANSSLLQELKNACPEDLIDIDIITAFLTLLVTPARDGGIEKKLRKAILGLANLTKMTADEQVRSDFLKPKTSGLSNDIQKNKKRLRPGMSIYATCIEPMTNKQTPPYHETYISTPGPRVICKRYRHYIYKIEGNRISSFPFKTSGGTGMTHVHGQELRRYSTCMQAGGDTSKRQGDGPLVFTSGSEPECATVCTMERIIHMGDYIEPAEDQVTKDSVVRVADDLLALGLITQKDAGEQMEVNGITKDLAVQYRQFGIPRPGEILVEKDKVVCSLPAQQVFNLFGPPTTWNPDQTCHGYKIPFVCITPSSTNAGKPNHCPQSNRQGTSGNGPQGTNTTYPPPPSSTGAQAANHLHGARSQHRHSEQYPTMAQQPKRGIKKPETKEKGRGKGKLTTRQQQTLLEQDAFGEGPYFNQRQPTKSGYGDRSTTYPQGHTSSRHSGASQSTARPGKGAASGGTHRPQDRGSVEQPDKGPHRGHRQPLAEMPGGGEVKPSRYSTPNALHADRKFSANKGCDNSPPTSMPPRSNSGLFGNKPYLNANNVNTGGWLPR